MYSLLAYSSLVKNGDGNEGDCENKVTDVHALLAQKEKDLILAAELGKALLEKNTITFVYAHKLNIFKANLVSK